MGSPPGGLRNRARHLHTRRRPNSAHQGSSTPTVASKPAAAPMVGPSTSGANIPTRKVSVVTSCFLVPDVSVFHVRACLPVSRFFCFGRRRLRRRTAFPPSPVEHRADGAEATFGDAAATRCGSALPGACPPGMARAIWDGRRPRSSPSASPERFRPGRHSGVSNEAKASHEARERSLLLVPVTC